MKILKRCMQSNKNIGLNKEFVFFYRALVGTMILPYIPSILSFIPQQILGFNWTGWAWIIMFLVSIYYLSKLKKSVFPIKYWVLWIGYLTLYLIIDYSFAGLQLSVQYLSPVFIGVVASSFNYNSLHLNWLMQLLTKIFIFIFIIAIFTKLVFGFTISMASMPMTLSIFAAVTIGLYYVNKKTKYLFYFGLIFLVPFLNVTRMGIAVFLMIFILHFANSNLFKKVFYGIFGIIAVFIVFNTEAFQKKTFHDGKGSLTDVNILYHEGGTNFNSSGRSSWFYVLEKGIKDNPVWGNGPRADAAVLGKVVEKEYGEAHSDYLSVTYNYGYVGLGLLFFGMLGTFLDIFLKNLNKINPIKWFLGTVILTLFIGFWMFMYTDNILKYTIFFPNLFFALIGIYYALPKIKENNF